MHKEFIFRVENEEEEGCYRYESTRKLLNHHNSDKKHPTPYNDKDINRLAWNKEICGFKNLIQVFKWFKKEELELLKELGYKLKKVSVSKITIIGNKQVLAIR